MSKQRVHSLQSLGNSNSSSVQETSEVRVLWLLNEASWALGGVLSLVVQEAGLGETRIVGLSSHESLKTHLLPVKKNTKP